MFVSFKSQGDNSILTLNYRCLSNTDRNVYGYYVFFLNGDALSRFLDKPIIYFALMIKLSGQNRILLLRKTLFSFLGLYVRFHRSNNEKSTYLIFLKNAGLPFGVLWNKEIILHKVYLFNRKKLK